MSQSFKGKVVSMIKFSYDWVVPEILSMGREDVIYVFSHIDADGITSAAIISEVLYALDKPFVLRFLPQIIPEKFEEELAELAPSYAIFLDLGTDEPLRLLKTHVRGYGLVIDHHITEYGGGSAPHVVFNPRIFGVDGSTECSSSTLTFLVANNFDFSEENASEYEAYLGFLGISGALGDAQDVGELRSLIGVNRLIVDHFEAEGKIEPIKDLLMIGRSIKPLYRLLAEWFFFELPGITGSYEGAVEFLQKLGILPKGADPESVYLDSISENKKEILRKKIIERLMLRYSGIYSYDDLEAILEGVQYKLKNPRIPIGYYGRDLAILLNASGKIGSPQTALAYLLEPSPQRAEKLLNIYERYRALLADVIRRLSDQVERVGRIIIYDGRGKINEELTSTISSIMARIYRNDADLVIAMAYSVKPIVKISLRTTPKATVSNLGGLVRKVASQIKGTSGGGHKAAAGMYVREESLDEVLRFIGEFVEKSEGEN